MHTPISSIVAILALAVAVPAQRGRDQEAVLEKLLHQYDKDQNGKIERAEYPRGDAAFANLDRDGNGVIEAADFAAAAAPRTRGNGRARPPEDQKRLPKVGDPAPDFELPMLGVKDKTVKLSSLAGDRPVVLIFGSYT
jgi:hypothetical protein